MIRSFQHDFHFWRLFLMFEQFLFIVVFSLLRGSELPVVQLLGGIGVLMMGQLGTFLARPYLYAREKNMDMNSRQVRKTHSLDARRVNAPRSVRDSDARRG